MKIIIFTHNYPTSLSERRNAGIFVHEFARNLAKTNSVSVVCPRNLSMNQNNNFEKIRFEGVDVYFFGWKGNKHLGKLKFWNPRDIYYAINLLMRGFRTISIAVQETRPDFAIAMWAIPGGFFAYFSKLIFGIPYVVWVLGSDFYVYAKIPGVGLLITHVLKNAKYIFADGISLSDKVGKTVGKKCFFLPSSTDINLSLKTKRDILNQKTKKGGQTVLTFIGRMEPIKGPDILLDAILQLKNKARNFKINFLGDGSLLPILKEKAARYGLKNRIKFYGNVDDKGIILKVLANTHWLIIPSRSDSIPLVFSEAMKVGVPIIASELDDLKYIINKYEVGICFKPENSEELSSILEKIDSWEKKRNIFKKNTGRVSKDFSLESSSKMLLKMIS